MAPKRFGQQVLVGIPTTSSARRSVAWIDAIDRLATGRLGSASAKLWIVDEEIATARNQICEEALRAGVEYIFFVSDDVLPPPDAVLKMLDKIGQHHPDQYGNKVRVDMVTGVYWTKTSPPTPYIWRDMLKGPYTDWKAGEFFQVDVAGCDCLLISTEMLKQIPRPWFSTEWIWEEGQKPSPLATEDYYFYLKARRHGFRLFCDSSIQCLHEDRSTGAMYGLTTDLPQAGGIPELGEASLKVADLGAGFSSPFFGPNVTLVRIDAREDTRPDFRADLLNLPEHLFGTFDVVHSRHVLEHIPRAKTLTAVAHWANLLKPGGQIIVRVPNAEKAMQDLLKKDTPPYLKKRSWDELYGAQSYDLDFHFQGFTPDKLEETLKTIPGVSEVRVVLEDSDRNLKGTARVTRPEPEPLAEVWAAIKEQEGPPVRLEDGSSPVDVVA